MVELLVVEINGTLAPDLASDEFLSLQRDVVLAGSTGSGKTHISVMIAGDGRRNAERAHAPGPSHQIILIRSPHRPRKTNICPANGSGFSTVSAWAASVVSPRRMSVTPAAGHMRVFARTDRSGEATLQRRDPVPPVAFGPRARASKPG